jgi:hypothetical protein
MIIAANKSRIAIMTEIAGTLVESWLSATDKDLDLGEDESARVELAASRRHDFGPDCHGSACATVTRDTGGRYTR